MTPRDSTPLTLIEFVRLEAFLKKHHPPLHEEIQAMKAAKILGQLPLLLRLLYEDMRRYKAGLPTRHVQFLPEKCCYRCGQKITDAEYMDNHDGTIRHLNACPTEGDRA